MKKWERPKDPDAIKDYICDWAEWLNGDTIATSTWTVPVGITKVSDTHNNTEATIILSGGASGTTYTFVNRITTTGGRTDERSIQLKVQSQ